MSVSEQLYREAEALESRFLYPKALSKYQLALKKGNQFWARRAAYRATNLIAIQNFPSGQYQKILPYIRSAYKSLLYDLESYHADPELWTELRREIRWVSLGLQSPNCFF